MINPDEYGRALFLLTEEAGKTEAVRAELDRVSDVLAENPDYRRLIDTPAIPKEEKVKMLGEAFHGFQPYLLNFLMILAEKRAFFAYPKAKAAFLSAYDEARGIERVEAVTAVPMTDAQKKKLIKKLEAQNGKTVVLKNTVDPSVLGGVCLRTAEKQTDGTLKSCLCAFEDAMKKTIV